MPDDDHTPPIASDAPAVRIAGSRFAIQAHVEPDKPVRWYDSSDDYVRGFVLLREQSSLAWEGTGSLWVRVAAELRAAGLLEPPLDLTKYVEDLRFMAELAELKGESDAL